MKRNIEKKLLCWKNNDGRKPLVLFGARQVGKTYTALQFGKSHYSNVVYLNFEGNNDLSSIFETNLNPHRIITALEAISTQKIQPETTLIIFDEIQASERAITSLKYFCEDAPQYHILAAGSLLGIAVNREKFSFPVGKVDMLTMVPLSFAEFLLATNNETLKEQIENSYKNDEALPSILHNKAIELYRTYLIIGGMPAAVNEYLKSGDFDFIRTVQLNIYNAYTADMAKYSARSEMIKTQAVYDSIPYQLARENKKFQYALIKSGARASAYENSLDWLERSGIVLKCYKTKEGKLPLEFYKDANSYKIYLSDVGLLCAKSNYTPSLILSDINLGGEAKGALTENYVAEQLLANDFTPFYWESEGKAELDFVLQLDDKVVPIECKSANNVKAKSFALFMNKYNLDYGIRISLKNFGFENNIKSVPLYAVFCIKK